MTKISYFSYAPRPREIDFKDVPALASLMGEVFMRYLNSADFGGPENSMLDRDLSNLCDFYGVDILQEKESESFFSAVVPLVVKAAASASSENPVVS